MNLPSNEPFFSIIVPTYNRAHLLLATLSTVSKQTFLNWECIIVDDGSTDNTKEVLAEVLHDSRFKYLFQNNAERSVARNNGIKASKGNYVCFLDSDDLFTEKHLEILHNTIISGPGEKLYFTNSFIDKNGEIEKQPFPPYNNESDYFIVNSVIPARVCISKYILDKYKFDPEIVIVEDSVLWTQIHLNYEVEHIKEETIIYRWHEENSVAIKNNSFYPRLMGLKRLFKNKNVYKRISKQKRNRALSNCYYGIAKYYLYKRKWFKMSACIVKSIFLDLKSEQTKSKIYMWYEFFR